MQQKSKNQKNQVSATPRKVAVPLTVPLPATVTKNLDDDFASSRKAERELDDITEQCKSGQCSPTFATARAFQLGVMYANELHDRANRKATLNGTAG